MAGLNLAVNVDTARAIAELSSLESKIRNTGTALKLAFAAATTGAVAQFADSLTNLRNKLTTLNESSSIAAQQLNGLAAIAIRSRSDLAAVGDLYYKTARAADQLGISQQEAAQITETISKAMKAAGQAGNEAAGPLYQLGQAFQSGTFQGDELRSIMEGLGPVAKIIANELGVTVGQLKKLGSEGQITGEVVARAMLKAKDSIETAFGRTIPTLSDSLITFRNLMSLAFNEFETNTQTAQNLARALEGIGYAIYASLGSIDEFIQKYGDAIIMIGKFILAFTAFKIINGIVNSIAAAFIYLGRTFLSIKEVITKFTSGWQGLAQALGMAKTTVDTTIGRFTLIGKIIGSLVAAVSGLVAGFLAFLGLEGFGDKVKEMSDPLSKGRQDIEKFKDSLKGMEGGFGTDKKPAPPGIVDKGLVKELNNQTEAYKQQAAELERRLRIEGELIGVSDRTRTIRQAVADVDSNYLKEINKLQMEYAIKSKSKNKDDLAALPEIEKTIAAITNEYVRQRQSVEELTAANYDKNEEERRNVSFMEASLQTRISTENQLRNLQIEAARLTLPTLIQQIVDLTKASEDQARQQIEQENQRRRSLKLAEMTAAEEQKYYNMARQNLQGLIDGQIELNLAKERYQYLQFQQKSELDIAKQLRDIQDQRNALGMSELERAYQKIDIAARESAESELAAFAQRQNIKRSEIPDSVIKAYYEAAYQGANKLKEAQAGLYAETRKFSTGWNKAMREYIESANDASARAARYFNKTVQGMEDLFVNFAKTGKFEWKKFVADMAEEILRSNLKVLIGQIFGPMTDAMSSGEGFMGALGNILGLGGGQRGTSQSNPLFVYDIASGRAPMSQGGGGSKSGGGGFLGDLWEGVKSVGSSIWEGVKSVGSSIWDGVTGIFGGGGGGGGGFLDDLASGIGSLFGGFFATGGQLAPGRYGVVGERGPELISGPANITPMLGTQVTYNINAVDAMSFKDMIARDPSFIYAVSQQGARGMARR